MKILGLGIDYSTGSTLIEPMDERTFAAAIQQSLSRNAQEIRNITQASTAATTFRDEIERERTVDLGDPRAAGWTFLINGYDPRRKEIIQILRPLAEFRGMENPDSPLLFHNEPPDEWFDWLLENYSSLEMRKVPHYVLIIGGPDQIPFHFQSLLGSASAIGRMDFDSLSDLETYIDKVLRIEQSSSPVVTRETLFFAPDAGPKDATYFSRRYMAEPLAQYVETHCGLKTKAILGDEATKENLVESLQGVHPALVYTASHGLGAPKESLEVQKQLNGAICCQKVGSQLLQDRLFSASDVPLHTPFLEGSVFFQFACFGYGTPAESDFMYWLGQPSLNAQESFVAALPKRLLAHPRGPIAFIGHVDTAWLHGFDNPENPHLLELWDPRISPFVKAVEMLLKVQPIGLVMAEMSKRYDIGNALLTSIYDRLRRGKIQVNPQFLSQLTNTFITRSDAQNYMIFGDPSVRLRIPTM